MILSFRLYSCYYIIDLTMTYIRGQNQQPDNKWSQAVSCVCYWKHWHTEWNPFSWTTAHTMNFVNTVWMCGGTPVHWPVTLSSLKDLTQIPNA